MLRPAPPPSGQAAAGTEREQSQRIMAIDTRHAYPAAQAIGATHTPDLTAITEATRTSGTTTSRHPAQTPPSISTRARALGFSSVEALKREVLRQRAVWWQGQQFHCPLCDEDFASAAAAADHVVRAQHPVLRMDQPPVASSGEDAASGLSA
jgi:hypothetical protein